MSRALACAVLAGCVSSPAAPPVDPVTEPAPAPAADRLLLPTLARWRASRPTLDGVGYLKGGLHVHTVHSGDSVTPTAEVVRFYDRAGFDFIVITDHNRITDPVTSELGDTDLLVLPGVELTNNPFRCNPPPPEENGRCRIHVNALFVRDFSSHSPDERPIRHHWRERKSKERVDLYAAAIRFARSRDGLVMLNHPTWFWGTDGELLAELGRRGVGLVEIANVAFERWNAGTDQYPGTEEIWDAALTAGVKMWGVATDDAHHYRQATLDRRRAEGKPLYPAGGGFVMVRARRDMESIRSAIERGDFYSSTGVLLSRAEVAGDALVVEVAGGARGKQRIEIIGDGGEIVATTDAPSIRYPLEKIATYARARVTAADGSRAWTQPAFNPSRARGSKTRSATR